MAACSQTNWKQQSLPFIGLTTQSAFRLKTKTTTTSYSVGKNSQSSTFKYFSTEPVTCQTAKPPVSRARVPSAKLRTRNFSSVEADQREGITDNPPAMNAMLKNKLHRRKTWNQNEKIHSSSLPIPSFPKNSRRASNKALLRPHRVTISSCATQLSASCSSLKKRWLHSCSKPSRPSIKESITVPGPLFSGLSSDSLRSS